MTITKIGFLFKKGSMICVLKKTKKDFTEKKVGFRELYFVEAGEIRRK